MQREMKMMTKKLNLLICMGLSAFITSCGIDVLTCETSPNGKTEACAYTKRIGDDNTYVTLTAKQTGKEVKIMKVKNVIPISFQWTGNAELNVEGIPDQNQVEYLNQGVMGVKINVVPQR